jgi:hypothetical protein
VTAPRGLRSRGLGSRRRCNERGPEGETIAIWAHGGFVLATRIDLYKQGLQMNGFCMLTREPRPRARFVLAASAARSRNSRSSFFAIFDEILHRQLRVANHRLSRALQQAGVPASRPRDGSFERFPDGLGNARQYNLSEAVHEGK